MSTPGTSQQQSTLPHAQAQPAHLCALAVQVRAATKTYPNGLHALAPIELEVREGDFATVLGPSGCGKSTLLRLIGGLSTPTAGSVALWPRCTTQATADGEAAEGDNRVRTTDSRRARADLAFVFQSPTLMPWASVERNVRLPLELAGAGLDAASRVEAALKLVALDDFAAVYPRELSGGMQMRASIARALVTEPQLLLMDEPFGALDEITRTRLDRDIRELWARRSLTVLFVTHSIYEAVYLSTRVLVMSARPGRIIAELAIGEPHPRTDAFRVSERYARWCKQLSELLAAGSDDAVATRRPPL